MPYCQYTDDSKWMITRSIRSGNEKHNQKLSISYKIPEKVQPINFLINYDQLITDFFYKKDKVQDKWIHSKFPVANTMEIVSAKKYINQFINDINKAFTIEDE